MTTAIRHATTSAATVITTPRRPATATPSWEDRSACYNRPEAWWDGEDPNLREKARAVCLSCPVLAECLGEQMRLEKGQMWSRFSMRGALTGPERTQLCIDEQLDGAYDAEEARLLALEAGAYGKPVAAVAEDGVTPCTLRLAARMAGEWVPDRDAVKAPKDSALERAFQHAEQIMLWLEDGVSRREICSRLALGRSTVQAVIRTYQELTGQTDAEMPTAEDAEQVLINAYLSGQPVRLTQEQQLAAIVEGLNRGMRYPDIDRAQSLTAGTTSQFVSRSRKRYQKAGRTDFPVDSAKARRLSLTDEQVLEIRHAYAAGGVTDLDLAMKYGVCRNVISHAVSGRNYKHVGGPIRKGRTAESKAASKAANDQISGAAFAQGRLNQEMRRAA